jgi:restriction endonuclease Mrr
MGTYLQNQGGQCMQGLRAEVAAEVEKEAHKHIEGAKAELQRASEAAAQERVAAEETAKRAEEAIEHWKARAEQNEGAMQALQRDIQAVLEVLRLLSPALLHALAWTFAW